VADAKYPHPKVEIITLARGGRVIHRAFCVHRHRFVHTAMACAKTCARGVPAGGGENLAVIYNHRGGVVAQTRAFGKTTRSGWKAETRILRPGDQDWLEVPRG
jgi:hypothetical protein